MYDLPSFSIHKYNLVSDSIVVDMVYRFFCMFLRYKTKVDLVILYTVILT